MTKVLFIKASPRDTDSSLIAVAESYLTNLKARHAGLVVDVLDLWKEDLPSFDGNRASAKLAVIARQTHTEEEKARWDEITAIASRFTSADIYLFAVPMWNGRIPYRLKQYIDVIHQPELLFGMDPDRGYFGLLVGKKAILIYTSGVFSPGIAPAFGIYHHSTYMRSWLSQAGVTDIDEVWFQPALPRADPASGLADAKAAATRPATRNTA